MEAASVLIWGTGSGALKFLKKINSNKFNILGFIDSDSSRNGASFCDKLIYSPEKIKNFEFDFLIIACEFIEVYVYVVELGVDRNKIIPIYIDKMMDQVYLNMCRFEEITKFSNDYIYTKKTANRIQSVENEYYQNKDYFRYRTFELVADKINQSHIKGEIAEVGVYQGEFAKILNIKFPDRLLYLFDTFSGFANKEETGDIHKGYLSREFLDKFDFKDTDEITVLSKMKHKEKCLIKKGHFPETAMGIDETFAFVSIDVDLYDPIYNAITYFYPRLSVGGYIFIHDYNNVDFYGVKKAIEKFEMKYGLLKKVPIGDQGGTIIVTK